MSEQTFYDGLIIGWFLLTIIVFLALLFIAAPYGRHFRGGWGALIGNKPGWIIMEAAAPLVFLIFFIFGSNDITVAAVVFLLLWQAHYIHRAFIYPLSLRGKTRQIPLAIVFSGLFFNIVNGYLNGRYIFSFSDGYGNEWLSDPRFIIGVSLFITGFIINRHADHVLRKLGNGESGYKIPYSGFYRWISSPNYFGEIIIWLGWAVATWSLAGFAFATWTTANLLPRARSHHAWYHENFPDYPTERKALLPKLW
ncbi:DUF1295 domain-containing protein [Chloroflexota bacterium]